MQITFAGQIIAQDPVAGGSDAITGFMPEKKPNLQWADYLRSTDAVPISRLNRKRTLSGRITPAPFATNDAAVQAALLYLDGLPDSGQLIFLSGTIRTLFANAVLQSLKVTRMGMTIYADLSFAVGPGANVPIAPLTDQAGKPLTDQSGNQLF